MCVCVAEMAEEGSSVTLTTGSTQEEYCSVAIPRGGHLFVPNFIGPLTRVPEFEASLLRELEKLKAEVSCGSQQECDEDLSVNELKVFSEEELVDMAMKEAFQDQELLDCSEQHPEGQTFRHEDDRGATIQEHPNLENSASQGEVSNALVCINGFHSQKTARTWSTRNSKKRTRNEENSQALEHSYMGKVDEIVKIKQKQDEDKEAARLHSFNAICKIDEVAVPPTERVERLKSLRLTNSAVKVKSSDLQENMPLLCPEIVLCVEVYHNVRRWIKTQEFLVLGRQLLTELRDKIYCMTDHIMQKAGKHDSSGYFLIEDFFCNDLRDPAAIDYSEPILEWLRNSKDEALKKWECIQAGEMGQKQKDVVGDSAISQLPQFKAVEMQKTRFYDLKLQLGAGYLYCHQGDCKHTIVIRDMRLIHPEDVHNRAAYPIVTFQQKTRAQKCCVCKIYRATKVTLDDKWAKENPCYYCDNCYFLLHYSKDSSLLYGDFSVYDYHHD
ncbi:snRNA-activating protein complex subunit isoform X2 [Rhodamnia argentea]|uniref:snRNA-activating protein complex subunit isoform X2 n=1 Tax=Rhodamnia argentea TaxID=178133 RepID=A0ABM3HX15_9MYRT|nr:snRNA-activating protein complex subunit isoform X2 [Rhodamnia argentea]